jgi:transposase InsO family protein
MHRLTWTRIGSVWAIDFVEPSELVDGRYPFMLSLLDVASRFTLLWQPVIHPDAVSVIEHLAALFEQYGAPLVLKADNGSAFLAEALKAVLGSWRVTPLYSPPANPEYNGACERNNGCLKEQTQYVAVQAGHGDWWSSENAEQSRLTRNATIRPRGHLGQTPDELWATRKPITELERVSFERTMADNQNQVLAEVGCTLESAAELAHYGRAAMDRLAIQRTLVSEGLLKFTRRFITLPLHELKAARIW